MALQLHPTRNSVPTGAAEEVFISEAAFRAAHRRYEANPDPSTKKRKREARGDPSDPHAYKGPWAKFEERRPDADLDDEDAYEEVEEEEEDDEEVEVVYEDADAHAPQPVAPTSKAGTAYAENRDGAEQTQFLGSQQYDYQGRTYISPPTDLKSRPESSKNWYPEKASHVFQGGHTAGVRQTRFFPDSGHLLLTAGDDARILLWDVYNQHELLRSFTGHTKAITDIDFTADGTHFWSGSYDRGALKHWDTETGACLHRFPLTATPHVIRSNPDSPHEVLIGLSNNSILQFDVRTPAKPIQLYEHHLGPVNTLTYVDSCRRFISTSDDRSLRVWEYGIPVPIKLVSDPSMHSLTRATPHPSGKAVLFNSAANEIVAYDTTRFRQTKKHFRGHNTAGSGIDVAVSPDGEFVASGDSAGFVCFWAWKRSGQMVHKMQTGKTRGACSSVQWHPRERSKVVTGGADGVVRLWS